MVAIAFLFLEPLTFFFSREICTSKFHKARCALIYKEAHTPVEDTLAFIEGRERETRAPSSVYFCF